MNLIRIIKTLYFLANSISIKKDIVEFNIKGSTMSFSNSGVSIYTTKNVEFKYQYMFSNCDDAFIAEVLEGKHLAKEFQENITNNELCSALLDSEIL
jgi:hypothetical protein